VRSIRILIADDHATIRATTRRILEGEEDMVVVAEARDGEEAVALAVSLRPDVAIIDVAMPALDGIEATRRIKSQCPATAVLIMTVLDGEGFVDSSLEVGASGYLLKTVRSHELVEAIRAVSYGVPGRSRAFVPNVPNRRDGQESGRNRRP
jgi:DNA-binding NarL/FixJ family response regulator